jgi:hypothetical protein
MTIIYADDPTRYCSSYALVTTPAELALRAEIRDELVKGAEMIALPPDARDRIAARLRASRDAAHKVDDFDHES